MFELQKAIKKVIERYIVNMTPVTSALSIGDTTIPLESSRRYSCGDLVVVYHKSAMTQKGEGEVHTISDIPDNDNIIIDNALISNYPLANTYVEKMVGGTFLEAIYLGDPEVIPQYPAITIDAKGKSNSWMTLESVAEEYSIDISVYVEADQFETQYELMHRYTKAIENSLFRSFYPLVQPFDQTTLVEAVEPADRIIRIADEDMLICGNSGWFWLESYDYLRANRPIESLGNGIYELTQPVSRHFDVGDLVIRPRRHFFNTLPAQIQYGTVSKGTTLKSSKISYIAQEERRIFIPYIDSLVL
jgi:hypothetical protein